MHRAENDRLGPALRRTVPPHLKRGSERAELRTRHLLAGLRTRGHGGFPPAYGRGFPALAGQCLSTWTRDLRSLSPLRDSPGFTPGSLLSLNTTYRIRNQKLHNM